MSGKRPKVSELTWATMTLDERLGMLNDAMTESDSPDARGRVLARVRAYIEVRPRKAELGGLPWFANVWLREMWREEHGNVRVLGSERDGVGELAVSAVRYTFELETPMGRAGARVEEIVEGVMTDALEVASKRLDGLDFDLRLVKANRVERETSL